jgi:beta-lactamase regulating signal transducer with metallopeptidase domain
LGSLYGVGGGLSWLELGLVTLLGVMILVGLSVAVRTCWVTRVAVRRLTRVVVNLPPDVVPIVQQVGLVGRLVVSDSGDVFSFCFGFLRPRVCVSTGLIGILSSDELRAVLAHEGYHLAERDPLKTACANVLAATCFPIPLVDALRRAYLTARELDADRAAMAAAGQAALAGALQKLLIHPRALRLDGAAAVGSISACGARLEQVMQPEKRHYARLGADVWLASAIAAAIFVVGGVGPFGGRSEFAVMSIGKPVASPLIPELCEVVWADCSADMASPSCCIAPAFDPHWPDLPTVAPGTVRR